MSCQQVLAAYETAQRRIAAEKMMDLQIARAAALNEPKAYLELLDALRERSRIPD